MDNTFIQQKVISRLTFNPGLALTGFRTTRPRGPVRQAGFLATLKRSTNSIELTKKMADDLNYSSEDEESEWLANIDPVVLDKSNEENQLDNSEISPFIEKK